MGYAFGVGREAPAFSLDATDGVVISLRDYRGDWHAVLVFFDGHDPRDRSRLTAFSAAADQLWGLRGQVLGIAVAESRDLGLVVGESGPFGFPLLADADGSVARAYAACDESGRRAAALTVVVDRAGKIVWSGRDADASAAATLKAFRDVVR